MTISMMQRQRVLMDNEDVCVNDKFQLKYFMVCLRSCPIVFEFAREVFDYLAFLVYWVSGFRCPTGCSYCRIPLYLFT